MLFFDGRGIGINAGISKNKEILSFLCAAILLYFNVVHSHQIYSHLDFCSGSLRISTFSFEEAEMPERRELLRAGQSPVEVVMSDGTHHHFTPPVLDVLLENNHVTRFRRKSGWVTVGVDPIRVRNRREGCYGFLGHDR